MSETTVEMFEGRTVARVRVVATVEFEAYAFVDDSDTGEINAPEWRIGTEIADAVQFRAVHLHDSEDTDALISMVRGGGQPNVDGSDPVVLVDASATILGKVENLADVVDAIDSTRAWI